MGMDPEATLAYGYDLGTFEDFKAEQRTEYGSPNLPWFSEDDEDEDGERLDFGTEAEKVLLASAGFTETDWSADGFYARQRAAKEQLGVDFDYAGSHEIPGHILFAVGSKKSVQWSDTMALDPAEIAQPRPEWDSKLTAALTALGLTPTQGSPKWLIFPFYG